MIKMLGKKLFAFIVYFGVFILALMVCGNFIPNPYYMLPFAFIVIIIIAYRRRVKRDETERVYLNETDSDELGSDIKYLFRFTEFHCELIVAAFATVAFFLSMVTGVIEEPMTRGELAAISAITAILYFVPYALADAVIWVLVFRQYHPNRIRKVNQ